MYRLSLAYVTARRIPRCKCFALPSAQFPIIIVSILLLRIKQHEYISYTLLEIYASKCEYYLKLLPDRRITRSSLINLETLKRFNIFQLKLLFFIP